GASAPGGRLPGGPGAAGGPGGARPGQGGAPSSAAGRLGAGPGAARGQVGTSGPRAALPARDGAPQGAPQSRTPQPQNAQLEQTGQLPQIPPAPQAPQSPDALRPGPGGGGLIGGAASAIPSRTDVWGNQSGPQAGPGPQQQPQQQQGNQQGGYDFPRAELPGGNPQPQRPQAASWGNDPQQQPVRRPQQEMSPLDAPRGHEEPESAGLFGGQAAPQGPGSTGQFPRPDFGAPQQQGRPQQPQAPQAYQGGAQDPASTAQFPRPDFGAPQGPGSTGQFPRPDFGAPQQQPQAPQPQAYQGGQQQQFGRQPYVPQAQQQAPQAQPPAPRQRNGNDFGAPRPAEPVRQPQQPQLQQPRRPEALPPAGGSGDGRTPLYDTLETNWFHQEQAQQQADLTQTTQTPVVSQPSAPAPRPAGDPAADGRQNGGAAWRTSPNDELVRQAERVRKPAAGGVTTSGLPRRVPKANLVPGTAQEQAHTAGPQVSRAPDDVRGRLTNLRRGIQQGRQAGNSTTGSHHLGPNHQQER
ncbi:histidine kinase, partial [Streptomyces tanashiensis]